ncbi:MAG: tripartite tricarboxylate transporter substrate binding protein BugD, partial [Pseudolabrys sp.]|nr:tripartite tricarboxylate transporter substrate binding protein BugD [Pseudolabrys sp.]
MKALRALAALALALATTAAYPQDKYPSRTVRIVVPFAAAGPTDVMA